MIKEAYLYEVKGLFCVSDRFALNVQTFVTIEERDIWVTKAKARGWTFFDGVPDVVQQLVKGLNVSDEEIEAIRKRIKNT